MFSCWTQIFFSHIGIGVWRGWRTHRKLHVDTLVLIPTWNFYVFWYSWQTDGRSEKLIQWELIQWGLPSLSSSRLTIWRADVSGKQSNSFLLWFVLIPKQYLCRPIRWFLVPAIGPFAQPRDRTTREEHAAFGWTKSTGEGGKRRLCVEYQNGFYELLTKPNKKQSSKT